jgi:hypothetical protein
MGFWSNLATWAEGSAPAAATHTGEWEAVFGQTGAGAGIPLGTARWLAPDAAVERFRYSGFRPGNQPARLRGHDASRIAAALIVIQNQRDPYWEEAARSLVKGLILHVMSASYLSEYRNLLGVRCLLTQGDWLTLERMREGGDFDGGEPPSAFQVLWSRMRRNRAFNGVIAGVGEQMIAMAEKQCGGVLEAARTNTEFIDSIPMQRVLELGPLRRGEVKADKRRAPFAGIGSLVAGHDGRLLLPRQGEMVIRNELAISLLFF